VIFDALQAAQARDHDVVIADTAGRLHNRSNLMSELEKIGRIIRKFDAEAPHEVLLVLDAVTGQNALNQAKEFMAAVPVTGLVLTKLDGTAKGGIAFALTMATKLPIYFVGVGEAAEDLRPFDPEEFVNALLDRDVQN
jgi:fused signal recognition particle receptor